MRKITVLLLGVVMTLALTACDEGGSDSKSDSKSATNSTSSSAVEKAPAGPVYKVDVEKLDPKAFPADYPLIAAADFEAAFVKLKAANMKAELSDYKSVADIFGVDGAYYENCDLERSGTSYKYYGWYADNEVSVLITFKADGNKLKYFAWSGNGIY